MHGTDFADKARAKLLEDVIDVHERTPESIGVIGVIRLVNLILIEANRIWNLDWNGPNLYVHS